MIISYFQKKNVSWYDSISEISVDVKRNLERDNDR